MTEDDMQRLKKLVASDGHVPRLVIEDAATDARAFSSKTLKTDTLHATGPSSGTLHANTISLGPFNYPSSASSDDDDRVTPPVFDQTRARTLQHAGGNLAIDGHVAMRCTPASFTKDHLCPNRSANTNDACLTPHAIDVLSGTTAFEVSRAGNPSRRIVKGSRRYLHVPHDTRSHEWIPYTPHRVATPSASKPAVQFRVAPTKCPTSS